MRVALYGGGVSRCLLIDIHACPARTKRQRRRHLAHMRQHPACVELREAQEEAARVVQGVFRGEAARAALPPGGMPWWASVAHAARAFGETGVPLLGYHAAPDELELVDSDGEALGEDELELFDSDEDDDADY